MKKLLLLLSVLSSIAGRSQNIDVKFRITDPVIYAHDNYIEINTRVLNNRNTSLILFNYLAVSNPYAKENFFHTRDITAGLNIYIKDSTGHLLNMGYPLGEPLPGHPAETVCAGALKDTSGNEFVNKMIKVKKKSISDNKLCFDLYYSGATKGTYKLYLFYYSGDNIVNLVDEDYIQSISTKYNAAVFKGWIRSNEVKLIVK